jgi:hypothetical protein
VARFSVTVQTGPAAQPTYYTMGTGSCFRVNRPGRRTDHPSPSSTEVEEIAEVYLYSSTGSSRPVHPTAPLLYHAMELWSSQRNLYKLPSHGGTPFKIEGATNHLFYFIPLERGKTRIPDEHRTSVHESLPPPPKQLAGFCKSVLEITSNLLDKFNFRSYFSLLQNI